jgi:hypothetical protein
MLHEPLLPHGAAGAGAEAGPLFDAQLGNDSLSQGKSSQPCAVLGGVVLHLSFEP